MGENNISKIKDIKDVKNLEGYKLLSMSESTGTAFFQKDHIIFFMIQGGVLIPFEVDKFLDVAEQFGSVSLYLLSQQTDHEA